MTKLETIALEITRTVGGDASTTAQIVKILETNMEENYLEESRKTDIPEYKGPRVQAADPTFIRLLHAGMGLTTEAGEFMDTLKKNLIYGKPMDFVNLAEELGDIQWYVALALRTMGMNFGQIHHANIEKLRKRFPNNFTEENALKRDLAAERDLLERSLDGKILK